MVLKALELPKLSKEIKFQGIWCELESTQGCERNHSENSWD